MKNMKRIAMEGLRFGRLTVVSRSDNIGPHTAYLCACDCGKALSVRGQSLRKGETTSCGCYRSEKMASEKTTHGKFGSPEYLSWRAMIARCTDSKHKQFKDYGGRGITFCERWKQFENFLADMGERPEGTTLDKINNDANYGPDNCRWATRTEQNRNKRNSTTGA